MAEWGGENSPFRETESDDMETLNPSQSSCSRKSSGHESRGGPFVKYLKQYISKKKKGGGFLQIAQLLSDVHMQL